MIAALVVIVSACSATLGSHDAGSNYDVADRTVAVPEFSISVKLSEKAEKELQSAHEGVQVLAMFDGDPLPGQGTYNPPMRGVSLGSDKKLLDTKNLATFASTKISHAGWNRLSDKNYFVTINVFSARKSSPNNLLDCKLAEDRISMFAGKTTEISCRMIGEN